MSHSQQKGMKSTFCHSSLHPLHSLFCLIFSLLYEQETERERERDAHLISSSSSSHTWKMWCMILPERVTVQEEKMHSHDHLEKNSYREARKTIKQKHKQETSGFRGNVIKNIPIYHSNERRDELHMRLMMMGQRDKKEKNSSWETKATACAKVREVRLLF